MTMKIGATADELEKIKILTMAMGAVLDGGDSPSWRDVLYEVQEMLAQAETREAEPLIKDEKIRKAVRAVANITGVSMLFYEYYEDNEMIQLSDMNGQILAFKSKKLSVKEFDSYAIAELCGDEEEE